MERGLLWIARRALTCIHCIYHANGMKAGYRIAFRVTVQAQTAHAPPAIRKPNHQRAIVYFHLRMTRVLLPRLRRFPTALEPTPAHRVFVQKMDSACEAGVTTPPFPRDEPGGRGLPELPDHIPQWAIKSLMHVRMAAIGSDIEPVRKTISSRNVKRSAIDVIAASSNGPCLLIPY